MSESSTDPAEGRLLRAVAAGNRQAQQELVIRLSGRVLRVARMLTRDAADAEDAAQRSLLQILESARTYSASSSLEAWADRITVRTTLRSARKEARRRGLLERWLPTGVLPWGREGVARPSEMAGLEPLLRRLPDERREVLVLRHVLEYEIEEIAVLTQTPAGTVKDRLVRGRKQLRRWLHRDLAKVQGALEGPALGAAGAGMASSSEAGEER